MKDLITERIFEMQATLKEWDESDNLDLQNITRTISTAFASGNKLLICGNGGSAADASHLAAEFVCSFRRDLKRPGFPAIALSSDNAVLTAYSNDFDFSLIFARQVEAFAKPGDVLLVISTSGNSLNCIKAAESANALGIPTLALTSNHGSLANIVGHSLKVRSKNTQIIQQCHQIAYHLIAELVEEEMINILKNRG